MSCDGRERALARDERGNWIVEGGSEVDAGLLFEVADNLRGLRGESVSVASQVVADRSPDAVVQMIGAGEESGKLGEVLDEVSDYYARQLKDQIKTVTGMIEPIMIIIMGSIVGFIAMAIILPIFKMSQIVS